MIPKISKEELRRIMGPSRRELTGQEYDEIRLILKFHDPVEINNSFHCWSETYCYNDKVYQVTGEFSHPFLPPIIEEMESIDFYDK